MASKNVQTILDIYENFNKRDLNAAVTAVEDSIVFESHGLGQTEKTRAEYRKSMQDWISGFSDVKVSEPRATEAGDTVIVQSVGKGTNDGPMGPFQKPTGRSMTIPFVELYRFNPEGRIVSGEQYFDMLSILVQLGHAERPAAK